MSGKRPENTVAGSVGKPLPGVEFRLAEDGELLVRAPGIIHGHETPG